MSKSENRADPRVEVTADEVRSRFLDYFAERDHKVVASSSLIPRDDPTLLFTNAGMNQFKEVFLGHEQRSYVRAVSSQKCMRVSGKHNDLENVGPSSYHHTFFEMLGNFSFGDYFKDRAIELAWNLITGEYGLPEDKLLVTVYAEDDEAFELWRKIAGLPERRIIRIPTSDNFWAMGDTGPCGPCSEIFFDHGEDIPGGPPGSPDEDGDRFIEIWNLVFMQYEQVTPEERVDLPSPSIDTGMGLERITAVLQGKHDNYDIDLMRELIEASAHESGVDPDGARKVSHRVIADHLRASSFLIADGVLPSNEGRGYVLRRIMRRAMRHAHMLGCEEPLLWKLVPALERLMGQAYPELGRARSLIAETLKLEETRFKQTLDRGLKLLAEETEKLGAAEPLAGEVAFRLYDTYGFPLDLTQDVLRGEGRAVELDGFEAAMERQRAEARKNWAGSGEAATEKLWFELRERHGATEFLGYGAERAEGTVLALVRDGATVDSVTQGHEVAVIVNQTPFYGEAGGQVGDTGVIRGADGALIRVTDTQKKLGDLIVHMGEVEAGPVRAGDAIELEVDAARRAAIRANHSATHLLHEALRRRLGEHIAQKGSLVAPERLRFDISHPKPVGPAELHEVESGVNAEIRANTPVETRLMTPDEAIEQGARALFGEKYGDEVRVVSMGTHDPEDGHVYSLELCGGTHVARTGDIGQFVITDEGAVAAGVRRVEALTGEAARRWTEEQAALLHDAAAALKSRPAEVPSRIAALLEERRRLERELAEARKQLATGGTAAGEGPREIGGTKVALRKLEGVPARELKGMADDLKKQLGSGIVAVVGIDEGKASLVVGVTEDLTDRYDAVALVRRAVAGIGGKGGGGRPDMAQGGGPDAAGAEKALQEIEAALQEAAA
jgi:alanyl-tRNA synthetase